MRKRKVVDRKYINEQLPFGGITITYLLYKQLHLHDTAKGVFLTLAIVWWSIVIIIVLFEAFMTENAKPIFEEE